MKEKIKKLTDKESERLYELILVKRRRGYLLRDEYEEYIILLRQTMLEEIAKMAETRVNVTISLNRNEIIKIHQSEEQMKLGFLSKGESAEYEILQEKIYRRIMDEVTKKGFFKIYSNSKQGKLF